MGALRGWWTVGDDCAMPSSALRTFHHHDFSAPELVAAKGKTTISVCLPARDEGRTIGAIVESIRHHLIDATPLVDELIVVDDGSTDRTAAAAATAGATVVAASDIAPDYPGPGKGQALWKSLHASSGDVVVWCDADIENFGPRFVTGLVGPLMTRPGVDFVKGFYERPLDGKPGEGGRVTELVARPLLSLLFPALSAVVQPLAGEYAGRRRVLERLPFAPGWGVDLALLIDLLGEIGLERMAQVDLGTRVHRNRRLADLTPQSEAILATVLERAGVDVATEIADLPPLTEIPAYRRRSA